MSSLLSHYPKNDAVRKVDEGHTTILRLYFDTFGSETEDSLNECTATASGMVAFQVGP